MIPIETEELTDMWVKHQRKRRYHLQKWENLKDGRITYAVYSSEDKTGGHNLYDFVANGLDGKRINHEDIDSIRLIVKKR